MSSKTLESGWKAALVSMAAAAVLLPIVMLGVSAVSRGTVNAKNVQPAVSAASSSDLLAFEYEVRTTIETGKKQQLEAIESQRALLERIESSVQKLLLKPEPQSPAPVQPPLQSVLTPVVVKSMPVVESPPVVVRTTVVEPVRVSSTHWNVQGNWNYSASEIADHLRTTHGVNPAGKSLSEMTAMHDNLHNGYAASGRVLQPAVSAVTTTKSTTRYVAPRRTRLFSRAYSSCPGGVCPTP